MEYPVLEHLPATEKERLPPLREPRPERRLGSEKVREQTPAEDMAPDHASSLMDHGQKLLLS